MTDPTENTAFINGNDSNKIRAFLDLPAWSSPGVYQRDALEHINSGVSGRVTGYGIVDLQIALFEAYQPNAVWLMCETTWNTILGLRDGNGTIMMPQKSNVMMLMGKPVVLSDDMPPIAANSLSIAYGDFGVSYANQDGIYVRYDGESYVKRGDILSFESIKIQKLAA